MNKLELLEQRNNLIEEMKFILNNCKTQKRELLKVEDEEFKSLQNQINQIDNTIINNKNQNKTKKMDSLFRNLIAASKGEEIQGQNEIKTELRKSGKEVADNSYVLNVRAVTPTGSADLVPTNVMEVASVLAETSLISKAGGHIVAVPADIVLPQLSKGTLSWEEEDGTETVNDNFTIASKKLTLNRLSGAFPLDKKMSKVVAPSLESAITDSIYKVIDEKVNEKLLADCQTTTNTVTAGTTNYDRLVEAEGMLLGKNVNTSTCVYIYNPTDLAKLKASGKKANEITEAILKDGQIGGYNAFASSFVKKGEMLFVDASQLWANIAFIELQHDPYTLASKGQDRIVINAYADTAIANIDYAVKVTLV